MTLTPGVRLGFYEVVSLLGAGGMGEVYRATDMRLKRDVAIKVLLPEVAQNPERLARFEREAQILASLNHPNIAAIYGVEQAGDTTALVLEYIDGPTLADRIAQGPIPLDEAVAIARQIAEALEVAHEQGIVHRDLKPANIKVRPDGTVKVLDFGLAKALERQGGSGPTDPGHPGFPGLTNSPTLTSPVGVTGVGVLLGTAAYMSPEQARGQVADRRSDIWAFGCVLFEMLTGIRLFDGATVTDSLAFVLTRPVDFTVLPASTPPSIVRMLQRCLQRESSRRLDSAAAVRLELEDARSDNTLRLASPSTVNRHYAWLAIAIALSLAMVGGVFLGFGLSRPESSAGPLVRLQLQLPDDIRLTEQSAARVVLSPDGGHVAFIATRGGQQPQVFIRPLDSLEVRSIPGTENASVVFWSPDSRQLGFIVSGLIKRVELGGGPPVTICEAAGAGSGAAWSREDVILFGSAAGSGPTPLRRVSANGGKPEAATALDVATGENSHSYPVFLPSGRQFLFRALSQTSGELGVFIGSLDSSERRRLMPSGSNLQYALGYVFFLKERVLTAQRFDEASLALSGSPVPVADAVAVGGASGRTGAFSVSETGVLAYHTASSTSVLTSHLRWFDRTGAALGAIGAPGDYRNPRLSPDATKLAVEVVQEDRNRDVWILDLRDESRPVPVRLTSDPANDGSAVWSADGRSVAYTRNASGAQTIFKRSAAADAVESRVLATEVPGSLSDSWNDSLIYYSVSQGNGTTFAVPWYQGALPRQLIKSMADVRHPRVSPDGKWIAYVSRETSAYDVYVQDFPSAVGRWRVSTAGGIQPVWSRDGKELFYIAPNGRLMSVSFLPGEKGVAAVGTPMPLFQLRTQGGGSLVGALDPIWWTVSLRCLSLSTFERCRAHAAGG